MLKKLNWMSILISLVYIASGIFLCMYPELSENVICYMIGSAAGVFGIIRLVTYFLVDVRDSLTSNDFVIGLISLISGILVIVQQNLVKEIVPILLGLLIITSGFVKLQNALVAVRIKYQQWLTYLLLAVISVGGGLAVIFWLINAYPRQTVFTWIGYGLIFCGASDLFITLFLTNKFTKFIEEYENAPQIPSENIVDAEIVHPEPVQPAVQPEPAPETVPQTEEVPAETPAADLPASQEIELKLPEEEPVQSEELPAEDTAVPENSEFVDGPVPETPEKTVPETAAAEGETENTEETGRKDPLL